MARGGRVRDCSEKAHSVCRECGQERRGLVTESPGRRQRPYYKIESKNTLNNQQLTITSLSGTKQSPISRFAYIVRDCFVPRNDVFLIAFDLYKFYPNLALSKKTFYLSPFPFHLKK
jgi:hypothetical protein